MKSIIVLICRQRGELLKGHCVNIRYIPGTILNINISGIYKCYKKVAPKIIFGDKLWHRCKQLNIHMYCQNRRTIWRKQQIEIVTNSHSHSELKSEMKISILIGQKVFHIHCILHSIVAWNVFVLTQRSVSAYSLPWHIK